MYASKKAAKEVIEHYKEQTYYFNGELSASDMKQMFRVMGFGEVETNVIIAALVLAGGKFTVEQGEVTKMIKTLSDIIKSNRYEFHHAAWHSGYVSRKLNVLDCKAEKYSGRYGNGYIVDIPSEESTQYCIRQYWILKK